jgi:hypothetical protein
VLAALKIIFESVKFSETMQEMRKTNEALYERMVQLGIAPAIE